VICLESGGGSLGLLSPDAVDLPAVITQISQQTLLLIRGHTASKQMTVGTARPEDPS
jgi:hypothetical protein